MQVTAESPIINTEQSDFSTNINQTTIANLPTNTRRWSTFALMTPGAAPDGTFGLVSFRGISGLLNNNTVDGGDNTQAFFAEERGRTRLAYSVSADAVREFQVTTSNYSAEYGRAAGGVVNAVTKSGTNELHGSGFYFLRDNKWGATNPFQTQNVFVDGVSTDSPGEAEGSPSAVRRRRSAGRSRRTRCSSSSATTSRRAISPASRRRPIRRRSSRPFTAAELATFQTRGITPAQQADGINFLTSLTGVVPRTGDQTLFLPKVDWKLNNSHSLAVTYNRLRWDSPAGVQTAAVVNRGIESWGNDGVNDDWTTARFTSVLGSRMTNEVKFQWGRDFEFQSSQEPAPGEPVSALGRTPQVTLTGAGNFAFGKPNFLERTSYPDERRIDIGDVFTISQRLALLKIGADISRVSDELDSLFQEARRLQPTAAAPTSSPTTTNMLAGVADAQLHQLQPGHRADRVQVPHVRLRRVHSGHLARQSADDAEPRAAIRLREDAGAADRELAAGRHVDLPEATGTTSARASARRTTSAVMGAPVIRGGYGHVLRPHHQLDDLERDHERRVGVGSDSAAAPDHVGGCAERSRTCSRAHLPRRSGQTSWSSPTTRRTRWCTSGTPSSSSGSVPSTMVSVSYVGSAGRNLPLFIDANLPQPSGTVSYAAIGGPFDGQTITTPIFTGARPDANFGRITTVSPLVDSKYNGLVLQVNRRLNKGLQFQASYTEARATDNGQSSQTFTSANNVLNPFELGLEEGTSNFEVRHRFVANAIWSPKVGAEGTTMNAIFSGFTISPTFVHDVRRALHRHAHGQHAEHRSCLDRCPRRWRLEPAPLDRAKRLQPAEDGQRRPSDLTRLRDSGNAQGRSRARHLQPHQPSELHGGQHADVHRRRDRRSADAHLQPDVPVADEREQQLLRVHATSGAARAPLHVLIDETDNSLPP